MMGWILASFRLPIFSHTSQLFSLQPHSSLLILHWFSGESVNLLTSCSVQKTDVGICCGPAQKAFTLRGEAGAEKEPFSIRVTGAVIEGHLDGLRASTVSGTGEWQLQTPRS